jgi:hypothetical protein
MKPNKTVLYALALFSLESARSQLDCLLGLLVDPEDGSDMFLRNVALHSRRLFNISIASRGRGVLQLVPPDLGAPHVLTSHNYVTKFDDWSTGCRPRNRGSILSRGSHCDSGVHPATYRTSVRVS